MKNHPVGGKFALDVLPAPPGAVPQGIAALHHEPGNDSVEGEPVIELPIHQAQKVCYGDGGVFGIQFRIDHAVILHFDAHIYALFLFRQRAGRQGQSTAQRQQPGDDPFPCSVAHAYASFRRITAR